MTNYILTIKQVADFLQMNPITIYRLAEDGKIPALKINSSWRFRMPSLEKWLEEKENYHYRRNKRRGM